MKLRLVIILFTLASIPALADDVLDLQKWQQLGAVVQPTAQPGLLPPKMDPVTNQSGVLQQIVNYNLKQLQSISPFAGKIINTNFQSQIGGSGTGTSSSAETKNSQMTIEVKPMEGKTNINFYNSMTASVKYQPFSHEAEAELTPNKTVFGMKIGFTHVSNSNDQQNKFVLKYEW